MVRLHLDENQPNSLASALISRGLDVTTTHAVGLAGSDDVRQLEWARSQDRVIITRDADFLSLHASGIVHAGIMYYPPERRRLGYLIPRIIEVSYLLTSKTAKNHVEYL